MSTTLRDRIQLFAIGLRDETDSRLTLNGNHVKFEAEELEALSAPELHAREKLRSTYSPERHAIGLQTGEVRIKTELHAGGTDATVKPPQRDLMLASGLAEACVCKIEVDLSSANLTFHPGEVIDNGDSDSGLFITIIDDDLYYVPLDGDFVAEDTLTGEISGASIDVEVAASPVDAGWAYVPDSTDGPVADTFTNKDGLQLNIFGARGTFLIECAGIGQLAYINCTLTGAGDVPVDVPLPVPATLPTLLPETFLSSGILAHGNSLCVDGFTFNLGNNVTRKTCVPPIGRVRNRTSTISIAPDARLEGDVAFHDRYTKGTTFGFFAQVGSSEFMRMAIVAPAATYTGLPIAERNGDVIYNAELQLNGIHGDDEFIIAFF